MLPFPFCFIDNDDFPPFMKDILGDKPMDTLKEIMETLDNKKATLDKLKRARDILKRVHCLNKKLLKDDPYQGAIRDGEECLEKLNEAIYDAERNIN